MIKDKKIDKDKLIQENWDLLMLINIIGVDVAIQTQLRELCIKLGIVNTKATFNRRIRLLEEANIIGRVKFFTTTNNKLIYLNRLVRARLMNRDYNSLKDVYKKDKKTKEIYITDYRAKLTMLRFEWFNNFIDRLIETESLDLKDLNMDLVYMHLFERSSVKFRECNGYGLLFWLNSKLKELNNVSGADVLYDIKADMERCEEDFRRAVDENSKEKIRNYYRILKQDLISIESSVVAKDIRATERVSYLLDYMKCNRDNRANNFKVEESEDVADEYIEKLYNENSFDRFIARDMIMELDGINSSGQYRFVFYILDVPNQMHYEKAGKYIRETVNLMKDCYGITKISKYNSDVYNVKLCDADCNMEIEFKIMFWIKDKLNLFKQLANDRSITMRTKKRKEHPNLKSSIMKGVDGSEIDSIAIEYINLDLKNKYYNEKRLREANKKYLVE